ncbi:uncharacterized protein LOC119019539 isoform X1 [Acanthopagrus latus]|uniref:uncharacterized protein LOC119019539 isoform X1 n=1 Tax=Acanthopagrus latus TaxID=8177 RepID=UPI00187C4E34|nr:uncharacterized protein LOC119019539 isoform X1 [Acanthopagrus latus]
MTPNRSVWSWTRWWKEACPSEQQWQATGFGFVIQRAFSALISNMSELILTFLLLLLPGLAQCFPVTANQAGSRPSQLFFCKTPGCAAEVTAVFCNEELLLYKSSIENCTGPPPLGTVCQHNGLAFVAINTSGVCDFEGEFRHIQTEKCKGDSDICAFPIAFTASPAPIKDHATPGYIAAGVCVFVLLVLMIGLSLYLWKKRRTTEQQQASDPDVTVAMTVMQSPGETVERSTDGGGPGLDDSCCPSQHDHGDLVPHNTL